MRSALVFAVALVLAPTRPASAQAPDPHNLSGQWQLNTWLSDPGDEIDQELRSDLGPADASDIFAAPEQGARGAMGGRMGRRGSQPRGGSRPDAKPRVSPEDQKRLQSVLDLVRQPAATLAITQGDGSITLADPVRGSHTFQVNAATQKQSFGSGEIESTTRWEGPQLITDYDAGHGVMLRFSYMLVPPANELLVRISVMMPGNQAAPFTVRHVYDRASR